jgi:hypothetical protein
MNSPLKKLLAGMHKITPEQPPGAGWFVRSGVTKAIIAGPYVTAAEGEKTLRMFEATGGTYELVGSDT